MKKKNLNKWRIMILIANIIFFVCFIIGIYYKWHIGLLVFFFVMTIFCQLLHGKMLRAQKIKGTPKNDQNDETISDTKD